MYTQTQGDKNGVMLGQDFYQSVLIELRSWGKDGEAVSCVYKAIRRGLGKGKPTEDTWSTLENVSVGVCGCVCIIISFIVLVWSSPLVGSAVPVLVHLQSSQINETTMLLSSHSQPLH